MPNDDLVEFIRSHREPVKLSEAASELHALGNLGADWPRASYEHWIREFEQLAKNGKLQIDAKGMVSVPREEAGPTQMTFF
jgi:hypothetical protein